MFHPPTPHSPTTALSTPPQADHDRLLLLCLVQDKGSRPLIYFRPAYQDNRRPDLAVRYLVRFTHFSTSPQPPSQPMTCLTTHRAASPSTGNSDALFLPSYLLHQPSSLPPLPGAGLTSPPAFLPCLACQIYTLERALTEGRRRRGSNGSGNGKVEAYSLIIDFEGFSHHTIPPVALVKSVFKLLRYHYPVGTEPGRT